MHVIVLYTRTQTKSSERRWEGKSSQSGCSVRLDREKQASGAPPRVFRLICIITSAQLQRQSVERLVGVGSDERSEGNEMKIKNGREEGGASRMLPLSSPQTPLSALQASSFNLLQPPLNLHRDPCCRTLQETSLSKEYNRYRCGSYGFVN